jgi:hypothetical protein
LLAVINVLAPSEEELLTIIPQVQSENAPKIVLFDPVTLLENAD